MESNIFRASATGLKSVELDEINTSQIIINNGGLQYLHKYNILDAPHAGVRPLNVRLCWIASIYCGHTGRATPAALSQQSPTTPRLPAPASRLHVSCPRVHILKNAASLDYFGTSSR